MKPDWDKLMKEYKDSKTTLIADVDCTTKGQPLCETHGVRGYPTIKHGDPNALEDYNGGRDAASMKKFAEGLKPSCSPFNIELCSDDQKEEIDKLKAEGQSGLETKIKDGEKEIEDAEKHFKAEVDKLQKKYQELNEGKDKKVKEIKDSGLGLMKSVLAQMKSAEDKEEL